MLIGHRRDFSSRADILNVSTSSTYLIKPIILPLINNYGHDDDKDLWGVSGPVVRALDSGSDGPGSSPGWGTTLWP